MKASDRFQVENATCRYDGQVCQVSNLSLGGFFVATPRPPMAGQFFELELTLASREPFTLLGKVTWVNDPRAPRSPQLPQGFGFKITRIGLAEKVAIVDLLRRSAPVDGRAADGRPAD